MEEKTYRIRINLSNGEIEVEGDKEFVKEEIRELIGEVKDIAIIPTKFETETHTQKTEGEVPGVSDIEITQKGIPYESFAEFYKAFEPKKEQEKSLIAVYWLNKMEGREKVTPKDVKILLKSASISLPSSISRDMRILSSGKKAYLIKMGKKGKTPEYKMSMTGEEYIRSGLKKEN